MKNSVIKKGSIRYEFLCQKNFQAEMLALLEAIHHQSLPIEQYYKNQLGDTTTVFKTSIGMNTYIIKRYNFRNLMHGLKLQFRKSYGFRSYYTAIYLQQIGIPTIQPFAAIQAKKRD